MEMVSCGLGRGKAGGSRGVGSSTNGTPREKPNLHRAVGPLVGLGCCLALLMVCYRQVLFEDAQFGSASASYYYPIDRRVQQEWEAGRWPLWDPGHNGGEPLLGNPMCAVFYPGKVL